MCKLNKYSPKRKVNNNRYSRLRNKEKAVNKQLRNRANKNKKVDFQAFRNRKWNNKWQS